MAAVTVGSEGAVWRGGRWGGALSGGQLWAVAVDQTNHDYHFFYSNDSGATWAEDTAAEITDGGTGADEEHCASLFIDANDVIWFVYASDTANGLAVQRGTVSGNAITWDDEGDQFTDLGATDPFVDIVAFPEGSNDRVFIGYVDTSTNLQISQALYSSGTFGSWTNEYSKGGFETLGGLDFNHTGDGKTVQGSAPHVWAGYTSGPTASRLNCVKLVWSAGPSWTANAEREVSGSVAADGNFNNCFGYWDGTRFVVGGLQSDGDIEVYERDSGDTATTDRTPGTQPTGRATADDNFDGYYDQATDDIYLLLDNTSAQPSYVKYDRSDNSWDAAVTVIEAEACLGKSWLRNEGGGIGNQLLPLWETSTPAVRTEKGVISLPSGGGWGMIIL